ncbi:MAG: YdeI/OmpD-associated family protein [Paracoccaceae bacterium]
MTEYIAFQGRIEPMVWGRATYTILRVPKTVVAALGPTKRVEGEMNDHPINLALTRAPVCPDVFLWAGQSLLERIGIAPDDLLEVRLRPAPDDLVDVPDDVAFALQSTGQTSVWAALTPGKQRRLLYQIGTAKTASTRSKRITTLIATLSGQT